MKEIFKLSKREKKIAKKAMNEAVVREFTEEEIEALMKSLTITKEKVQKNFMKYGVELEKQQKLEEALEKKLPHNAKATLDVKSLMRYKRVKNRQIREVEMPRPHYFRCGFTFVDGSELKLPTATEEYRKKLMENMKESDGTNNEQFLRMKKNQIKKNRKKFKKLMKIANEGANEIMNDSLIYNKKLKELVNSNIEFDKRLKLIPEEMVIKEKKALKLLKL